MPNQMNFLVDENETIGKDGKQTHGPNAVISMLDYILETQGREERSISLHADNCPGQHLNYEQFTSIIFHVNTIYKNKSCCKMARKSAFYGLRNTV